MSYTLSRLSILIVFAWLLAVPAYAAQQQTVGNFDIHYSAFNSTFLTPAIAKANDIERSRFNGVVNISVMDTRQATPTAVPVEISGIANNLLDARMTLKFRQVKEGDSIYYLAEVPFRDNQVINFQIAVKYGKELNTVVKFKQHFYTD
ncbi:DUF4426 domain-containing protein [Shewanella sp. NIFS-20-20]|uniref:DUF4426 domain-containing protein n=1 Tax=Shewanella sp. NIFS-20-20 TaxID=2853806 RepID=UPI001C46E40A|nr:DUF4426 domain-containing protein [Shewanella sp. NIFS-20-20]MBV7316624.1 DUF4426 domain-containing protein [Shewanella sp. NIFS-20-20]